MSATIKFTTCMIMGRIEEKNFLPVSNIKYMQGGMFENEHLRIGELRTKSLSRFDEKMIFKLRAYLHK